MTLLGCHILRHGHTAVPFLLPQSQVVGVYEILDFVLDGTNMSRHILLGEELLLAIIVNLFIADASDKLGTVALADCSLIVVGLLP